MSKLFDSRRPLFELPKYLYFGLRWSQADDARRHGVWPVTGHVMETNEAMHWQPIRLTDRYAPHFALQLPQDSRGIAVLQIATNRLDPGCFEPDPAHVAWRAQADAAMANGQKCARCDAETPEYLRHDMECHDSLSESGIISYTGHVPRRSIISYVGVQIDQSPAVEKVCGLRVTPGTAHSAVGSQYAELTAWLFGKPYDLCTLLCGAPFWYSPGLDDAALTLLAKSLVTRQGIDFIPADGAEPIGVDTPYDDIDADRV